MHFVNAKGILSSGNNMNIYRGCTHGCIYCDSRSKCYDMKHAFEDIEVKTNAPLLLEQALAKRRNRGMITTGAMSDPYMPCEKKLELMRKCLEIIYKYGFGVALQTKSNLVLRDTELLKAINAKTKAVVQMTITAADDELCRKIEPWVCPSSERIKALAAFGEAGIPTVVWVCPILPMITDSRDNIERILESCQEAGVKGIISMTPGVTMREGNREYFYDRLPSELRRSYIEKYGGSYECTCDNSKELTELIKGFCGRYNMMYNKEVFEYIHRFEEKDGYEQLSLL